MTDLSLRLRENARYQYSGATKSLMHEAADEIVLLTERLRARKAQLALAEAWKNRFEDALLYANNEGFDWPYDPFAPLPDQEKTPT